MCVCSRSYPAFIAHAPYYHLWPILLYNIFPHYLINCTIFEKKMLPNTKSNFSLSLSLSLSAVFSETFFFVTIIQRDIIINVRMSSCTPYSHHILMKLGLSLQIFEKYSNTKFRENPSSGSWVVPCGETDKKKLTMA